MGMTPEHALKLIEALRKQGHHVLMRATPDSNDVIETSDGHYSVMLRGHEAYTGPTFLEALLRFTESRCWDRPAPAGTPTKVKVADILTLVAEHASQYTTPFQADEIALELNVFPAAVGQALKKLGWPKSQKKALAVVNGREVEVYVYLPKIG